MTTPDYVVVGHVTKDVIPGGFVAGGTVTYAGLTAWHLGARVGILTSAAPDFDLRRIFPPEIELVVVPSAETTTFENIYHEDIHHVHHRRQYLRAVASTIGSEHVPPAWRDAPIVHFAPLAREFTPALFSAFSPDCLRGLTPQGFLRRWDSAGLVSRIEPPTLNGYLSELDAVVLSEEDVGGDWEILDQYAAEARLLVVTRGPEGAVLRRRGAKDAAYPAYAVEEVDPTGAGDVFAAAFLIRLRETGDPEEATCFANCVASFAVEGPGTTTLPTLEQVNRRGRCSERGSAGA